MNNLVDAVKSLFQFFYDLVAAAFNTVLNFVAGVLNLTKDTAGFLISNLFIILVIAAAGYGYVQYRARQGNPVVVNNKKLQ